MSSFPRNIVLYLVRVSQLESGPLWASAIPGVMKAQTESPTSVAVWDHRVAEQDPGVVFGGHARLKARAADAQSSPAPSPKSQRQDQLGHTAGSQKAWVLPQLLQELLRNLGQVT